MRKLAVVCVFGMALGMIGLVGCESQEGAFERGGERIDRGIDNARDSIDDARDRAGDAMERDSRDDHQDGGAGTFRGR